MSICLTMVHSKCDNVNVVFAEIIKTWIRHILNLHVLFQQWPFAIKNDQKLSQTLRQSIKNWSESSNNYSTKTGSILKLPKNLSKLFNGINDFFSQQKTDTGNSINCKYYNIDEIQV